MNKEIKIVFMGTPEFAVPTLEKLNQEYTVSYCVTVPDKEQGRGRHIKGSAVKEKAIELGIPVLQPESLKDEDFINELKSVNADIFCVVAFRILPEAVYTLPKLASFNIHGSLLPKFRGAAPINWAIINGEKVSGLSSFILQKKVDTGDILLKREVNIIENMTAGQLHDELMVIAPELAKDTIELLISGKYTTLIQDNSQASPAPKIFKDTCLINWNQDENTVVNHIHGLSPHPGAFTHLNGKILKILKVKPSEGKSLNSGEYSIEKENFYIGCKGSNIEVIELQLEGKSKQKTIDFIHGWRGEKFGKIE